MAEKKCKGGTPDKELTGAQQRGRMVRCVRAVGGCPGEKGEGKRNYAGVPGKLSIWLLNIC